MTTPNLQLPEVPEAIQEASDEINAGFRTLDAIVQLAVKDKDLVAPPGDAVQGDRFIVPPSATAAWTGWERSVAFRGPSGWMRFIPRPGWRARVLDEDAWYLYDGTEWIFDGGTEEPSTGAPRIAGAHWTAGENELELPIDDQYVRIPYSGTITSVTLLGSGTGDAEVDIMKDTFANYPPDASDSITGGVNPSFTGTNKYFDDDLGTAWNVDVTAGDVIGFHLVAVNNLNWLTVLLSIEVSE